MILAKARLSGRRLQRQRVADENIWRSRVSGYFMRAKKPVLAAIRSDDYLDVIYKLDKLIPVEPLFDLYTTLYTQLTYKYYLAVTNGLQKNNVYDFSYKAEPPEEWQRLVNSYIQTELAKQITGVNGVTRKVTEKAIRDAIQEAIENGYGVEKTKKLIEKAVDKKWIAMRRNRARVIARTEAGNAMNWASFEGAQNIEQLTGLTVKKAWLSYKDNRTRTDHYEMNSQEFIGLNDLFLVGTDRMMRPNDSSYGASAANIVSCRCVCIWQTE